MTLFFHIFFLYDNSARPHHVDWLMEISKHITNTWNIMHQYLRMKNLPSTPLMNAFGYASYISFFCDYKVRSFVLNVLQMHWGNI